MSEITIPTGCSVCLTCNGSTRRPVLPSEQGYKKIMSGYDATTDTMSCGNCGGQAMFGRALGYTRIDPATGLGCQHEYMGRNAGPLLHHLHLHEVWVLLRHRLWRLT